MLGLLAITALVATASAKDLTVGQGGVLVFHENVTQSPTIWKREANVTIEAPDTITSVVVIDNREDKRGEAVIVDGGVGFNNVTIQLKSPAVFRGFYFEIQVYAKSDDGQQFFLQDAQKHVDNTQKQSGKPEVFRFQGQIVTPVTSTDTSVPDVQHTSQEGKVDIQHQTQEQQQNANENTNIQKPSDNEQNQQVPHDLTQQQQKSFEEVKSHNEHTIQTLLQQNTVNTQSTTERNEQVQKVDQNKEIQVTEQHPAQTDNDNTQVHPIEQVHQNQQQQNSVNKQSTTERNEQVQKVDQNKDNQVNQVTVQHPAETDKDSTQQVQQNEQVHQNQQQHLSPLLQNFQSSENKQQLEKLEQQVNA